MLRRIATFSVLTLALSGVALAQTAPAPTSAPAGSRAAFAERRAPFALRAAYRTITEAEARRASTYLDAAKTHYRDALARLGRHDPGAASEAMAAAALARAAIAEHPIHAPRDIPAPPALAAGAARPMPRPPIAMNGGPGPQTQMRRPQAGRPQMGGAQMRGPQVRGRRGPRGMSGRFDATRLAADAKLANTAEARDLAQKALDADIARTRAAFSGNVDEAMRQGRVASSLAMAVRALAFADHPPTRTLPRGAPATVGLAPSDQ